MRLLPRYLVSLLLPFLGNENAQAKRKSEKNPMRASLTVRAWSRAVIAETLSILKQFEAPDGKGKLGCFEATGLVWCVCEFDDDGALQVFDTAHVSRAPSEGRDMPNVYGFFWRDFFSSRRCFDYGLSINLKGKRERKGLAWNCLARRRESEWQMKRFMVDGDDKALFLGKLAPWRLFGGTFGM